MVLLVVAAPAAAAVGCTLMRHLPFFIADEAGTRLLRPAARPARRFAEAALVVAGVLLAVVVLLVFDALTPGAPLTSEGTASAAEAAVGTLVPSLCLGLGIGAAAGASPILAWIDLRIHRLPDRIVLPLLGITAVLWALAALSGGRVLVPSGHGLGTALVIGAACGVAVLVVSVLGGRGRGLAIGLGDVKLAVLLGALTALAGTGAVLAAFVVAQLSACVDAVWQVLVARRGLATRLAYGPHLLLGMWTGPLVHAALR